MTNSTIPSADEDLYFRLGANIGRARRRSGLTQRALGAAVGLTRASIANAEAGRQKIPLHVLLGIAEVLQVNLGQLLGDIPGIIDPPRPPDIRMRKRLEAARREIDAALNLTGNHAA